jgi:hypothetical protein
VILRQPERLPEPNQALRYERAERAISALRLSSGGLRGLWLVDTRTNLALATQVLAQAEMQGLERLLAASAEIFQAGVSMEMLAARDEEPPVELTELILVGDELVAGALLEPRGHLGIVALLAPEANIALEMAELRGVLSELGAE